MTNSAREVHVTYKKTDIENPTIVTDATIMAKYLRELWPLPLNRKECFMAVYLGRGNKILGHSTIGIGGMDAVFFDKRLIFQEACLVGASAIIIAHNHPSGGLKPSSQDINLTKEMRAACKIMHMQLLDHLIITEDSHTSI